MKIGPRTRNAQQRDLPRGTLTPCRCQSGQASITSSRKLNDVQRPHLEALRELSRDADPEAREELTWKLPVHVRGEATTSWMLQNFKSHCSPRFPLPFFATQKAAVEAAGYEAGEGFIKLPYSRVLPAELLKARVEEYAATGAGSNER
jgi:uncharacterized protein YdhG (YjbR/CyaY superfamily)